MTLHFIETLGESANWTRGCSLLPNWGNWNGIQSKAVDAEASTRGGKAEAEDICLEFSSRVDILLQQPNLLFCRNCLRCKTD